ESWGNTRSCVAKHQRRSLRAEAADVVLALVSEGTYGGVGRGRGRGGLIIPRSLVSAWGRSTWRLSRTHGCIGSVLLLLGVGVDVRHRRPWRVSARGVCLRLPVSLLLTVILRVALHGGILSLGRGRQGIPVVSSRALAGVVGRVGYLGSCDWDDRCACHRCSPVLANPSDAAGQQEEENHKTDWMRTDDDNNAGSIREASIAGMDDDNCLRHRGKAEED
ncbi:hypothetical protein B0H13DRAFT_2009954, partial [Mycena leptocephala]